MSNKRLATREYIKQAALSHDTAMAAAFCKALGIKPRKREQRTGHHRRRDGIRRRDLEQCRKQKHGVIWHEQG